MRCIGHIRCGGDPGQTQELLERIRFRLTWEGLGCLSGTAGGGGWGGKSALLRLLPL